MSIDNTYMNVSVNAGNAMGSMPAFNNLAQGNPFIASMHRVGQAYVAQYKQMNEYIKTLQAQNIAAMKASAKANSGNNISQTPLFTYSSYNNSNKTQQTNSSSLQLDYGNSALKPGLFKGALAGKEALVTRLCRKYGVNPALVASIIGLESGWGTSNLAMHNNFGGLKKAGDLGSNGNGFGYFSSVEKGLEEMIKNLAKYPHRYGDVSAVDFNNLDAIGRHYCDASWASKVRNVYNSRVRSYLA